jgi:hypothetical protein
MATLLLLTNAMSPSSEVLPALGLLGHSVRVAPAEVSALVDAPRSDAVLVDARRDLAGARSLCRLLRTTGLTAPLFVVLTEGGLVAPDRRVGRRRRPARHLRPGRGGRPAAAGDGKKAEREPAASRGGACRRADDRRGAPTPAGCAGGRST